MSISSVVGGKSRRASALVGCAAAAAALLAVSVGPAHAQNRAFQRTFTKNLPGQLVILGNSVVTCDRGRESAATCNAVETGQGAPTLDNDTVATAFIDIDEDATTFNSSAAQLQINGDVEWAGLYWWGSIDPVEATRTVDTAGRDSVLLRGPGAAAYASVASVWGANGETLAGGRLPPYLRFADVTAQVKAGGAGTYQVANVVTFAGQDDHLGGWALVVVNRDEALPFRHISLYDGYQNYGDANAVNIMLQDFLTPLQGPLDAQVTFIALDGDAGKNDSVAFNGQALTNALNPVNDFGNSTISRNGMNFAARTPAFPNTLGTDIDTYNVSTLITNGAASAMATFTALPGELNFATFIGFQTTLYSPEVEAEKTASDLNGGQTQAGDELEYVVTVRNGQSAQDTAVLVELEDVIPANTTYVPGSLALVSSVAGGPAVGPLTDAAGDDVGEYVAGTTRIRVRLGAGATAATGGALLPGQTTSVRFRVTINPALAQNTTISNQATISFQGLTLSQTANSAVITVTSSSPTGGPTTTPVIPRDSDNDGLPDVVETVIMTDPNDADSDDDGLLDGQEPDYDKDTDADGKINALDPDSDGDGLFDGTEAGKDCANPATDAAKATCVADADPATTTSPINKDTDGGTVSDGVEDFNKNGRIDAGETNPNDPADDVMAKDTDGDGIPDNVEVAIGTDPNDADSDDDGLIDGQEPDFDKDSDGDGLINALDPDSDNDGLFDGTEAGKDCTNAATNVAGGNCVADADPTTTTNPLKKDTDDGGKPDGAEDTNLNGRIDAGETDPNNPADDVTTKPDSDGDGLPDDLEEEIGSNPMDADSDDDGLSDGEEVNPTDDTDGDGLINILDPDSDNDGLFDGTEAGKGCTGPGTDATKNRCIADADQGATKTSPLKKDTDNGGKPDGAEDVNRNGRIDAGETDPNNPADDNPAMVVDTDMDGLSDDQERDLGSDPNDADSDDDGLIDGQEPNPGDDTDADGIKNILDPDSDGDGLFDGTEAGKDCANPATDASKMTCVPDADPTTTTSGVKRDTDNGGVPDGIEDKNKNGRIDAGEGNPNDPADDKALFVDTDMDGVSDEEEMMLGSNPNDADSDDDGLLDGQELDREKDSDADGIKNILDPDSDNDGLFDGTEAGKDCSNPATEATKNTCIADADPTTKTNPLNRDTDGGTVSDGDEDINKNGRIDAGERNPNDPADDVPTTPPPPGLVNGIIAGGGCDCSLSGGRGPGGAPVFVFLVLGGLVVLHSRRRR